MNSLVTLRSRSISLAVFIVFLWVSAGVSQPVDYTHMSKRELQDKIASFELGFDSYIVGKKLTDEQIAVSKKDNAYKAYPGTYKFKDGDVFVIADVQSKVVIAVYKRNKKADKNDFKMMISELMMQYGEPTAEAHGKTIYWNYGEDGLISEELYRAVKSKGQLETLTILATVKFSSSENVSTMTDMIDNMMEKQKKGEETVKEDTLTSDNYVMIQSDILSKKYMKK